MSTFYPIILIFFLVSCNNWGNNKIDGKKEVSNENILSGVFLHPDTSVSKIILRDVESFINIFGDREKVDENGEYHYYSHMHAETLTLTQYPGDEKFNISLIKVRFSDKADYGYTKLDIKAFTTEKGIILGMSKKQIIDKIGRAYSTKDSTKGYIELYYKLEKPNDSKNKILERNNMPVYFASYKLWNDKLEEFRFGYEYP